MIVSHWGQVELDGHSGWMTARGTVSRWVNYAGAWASFLFYGWSLVAPLILTNREF
jgi:hypothetical protein